MSDLGSRTDYDLIIVGGRCAGAATARLLAQQGARVLVLERAQFGSDTLSTSYLMRGAVLQLRRWGLLGRLARAGTPPVRVTHFHYAQSSVAVPIRPADGVDALYAPRRTVLDPLLARAAVEAGAELRFGARVVDLLRDTRGRVCGVSAATRPGAAPRAITAGRVIGADGLSSSVARWVSAETYRTGRHAGPAIYGYFADLPLDAYHWYYANGVAAGAAPTDHGLSTVFVSGPAERLPELHGDRQAGLLRVAREVSEAFGAALADARREGPLRAFPGARGFYRKPFGPGWALVGDAGYFRDPNTAHGISDALRDAELLAQALCAGDDAALAGYQATRDRATRGLFDASDELASGAWDDARVEQLLRAASAGMRDGVRVIEDFDRELPRAGAA